MKRGLCILLGCMIMSLSYAQYDWDGIDVPAESDKTDVTWELIEALSDDFNYETPSGDNKGEVFNAKWEDGYINSYPGFGKTIWTPDNSQVTGGNLEFKATVNPNVENGNYFSAIHARTSLKYPAYIETRVKIMNSVMANAVWMLSENSAEEIDIVEAYGSSFSESAGAAKTWFAQRMHLSHHTFDRSVSPIVDYQPKDGGSYYQLLPAGSLWRDGFHTVGVYWRDPFHLEYYVDGNLVRTVTGAEMIDPNEHLDGNGLTSPETIIVSGAAQQWQVNNNVYPTDNELSVEADNVFKVDWIRAYQRIGGEDYSSSVDVKVLDKVVINNPVEDYISLIQGSGVVKVDFYNLSGSLVLSQKISSLNQNLISVSDLTSGMYVLSITDEVGDVVVTKIVKK